jgi:MFS family permease
MRALTPSFNMAIAASFLSAILLLAFWIPLNSTAALIACLVLYGFTAGMFITLTNAVTAQISTMSEIGQRIGLMCTVLSVFALVGPPINGALLAAAGEGNARRGYQYAGAFSGAMVLTGCALVVAARRCQTREWIKII